MKITTPKSITTLERKSADLQRLDAEIAVALFGRAWYKCEAGAARWTTVMTKSECKQHFDPTRWPHWRCTLANGFDPTCPEHYNTVPHYSTDIAAAWDVEEEIRRRGLYAEYGEAMSVLLDSPFVTASFYDFLHASPELRCRAALLTVRAARSRPGP